MARPVVLQGVGAAPGVVRGAHERFWWVYDGEAAQSAIGVAEERVNDEEDGQEQQGGAGGGEGGGGGTRKDLPPRSEQGHRRKEEVAEQLRGFLTRYFTLIVMYVYASNGMYVVCTARYTT